MTIKEAMNFRKKIEMASAWSDDADALEMVDLFPLWKAGKAVIVGERVQHNEVLYKCLQEHTTQEDWTPDVTPALWSVVSVDEYPQWVQPTGSADAYQIGDKVTYNERHYVSLIANNVWSPDAYPAGWDDVSE